MARSSHLIINKTPLSNQFHGSERLVPTTNVSSLSNLSYLNLLLSQQPSNNAVPSRNVSSNQDKRSSLLHSLFGRSSSKRKTLVVNRPLKTITNEHRKRMISGGDQVKLSSTKIIHLEHPYNIDIQKDVNINQKNTNIDVEHSYAGLCYDYKQIKNKVSTNSTDLKQASKENLNPILFPSHTPLVLDESVSSLSDPTSIRQPINEEKAIVQSVQSTVGGIPKMKPSINTVDKISFNPYQHKYTNQTPTYHYPKRLSAIEVLAKKYSSSFTSRNSTGLFWYNANHQPMNRAILPFQQNHIIKQNKRVHSSSSSRDTSTSSNTSSSSSSGTSTKPITNHTLSSSSTTSRKSSSNSTTSSSQSEQQTIKILGHYNRNNHNKKDDLIEIDLNSTTSQMSTSTSTTTTTTTTN
ncbi:hypothetical protein I4U23_029542 [Adineta vaga]|nr:hypothetical protein I4U23_029542 [Adineta vaga]